MKDWNKALLICVGFLMFFALIPQQFLAEGFDYDFHLDKARGNDITSLGRNTQEYAPLYSWLSSFFIYKEIVFKFFGLLMLGLIIPMLVFKLSKDWFSVLLYFTTTSFFYFFEQGIYAQPLAMVLMLIVIIYKNNFIRILVLFLSLFAHSLGFQLVLLALFFMLLHETGWIELAFKKFKNVLLGCSGWFPIQDGVETRPNGFLDAHLFSEQSNNFSMSLRVSFLLKLIIEVFPLPYLYFATKQVLKNKDYGLFGIALASLLIGSFMDYRVFFVIPLVLLPALADFYRTLTGLHQKGFLILMTFTGLLNFIIWVRFKTLCFNHFNLI